MWEVSLGFPEGGGVSSQKCSPSKTSPPAARESCPCGAEQSSQRSAELLLLPAWPPPAARPCGASRAAAASSPGHGGLILPGAGN